MSNEEAEILGLGNQAIWKSVSRQVIINGPSLFWLLVWGDKEQATYWRKNIRGKETTIVCVFPLHCVCISTRKDMLEPVILRQAIAPGALRGLIPAESAMFRGRRDALPECYSIRAARV